MIIGQGIDIVEIKRVEKIYNRFRQKFIDRIFSKKEKILLEDLKSNFPYLISKIATRFAAKEATSKALGTGFRDGIKMKEIEIINEKNGKPFIQFSNKPKKILEELILSKKDFKINLSMSNEKKYAIAIVTISS